ncbi:hypothetical protein ACVWYH_000004 [Bradyrhizobium sp. GM24.11]
MATRNHRRLPRDYGPELVDGADGEPQRERIVQAKDGDFLHESFDMPFGVCTAMKNNHVTNPKAFGRHAFALKHDGSFEWLVSVLKKWPEGDICGLAAAHDSRAQQSPSCAAPNLENGGSFCSFSIHFSGKKSEAELFGHLSNIKGL